jgi:hypothetical protein
MKNFINRFFLTLVFVFSLLTNANSQMLIYGRISGTQVVKLGVKVVNVFKLSLVYLKAAYINWN